MILLSILLSIAVIILLAIKKINKSQCNQKAKYYTNENGISSTEITLQIDGLLSDAIKTQKYN